MTEEEKKAKAKEMYEAGYGISQIEKELGISVKRLRGMARHWNRA